MNAPLPSRRFNPCSPKSPRPLRRWLGAAGAVLACAGSAHAATLTWNATPAATPPTDGTGTWDLATTNWYNPATASNQAWNNANLDTATFGANTSTATSTVTIAANTNVTVGGITFNGGSSGYVVAGGTGATLTLGGTAPLITVNKSSTISAVLAGSSGLTVTGSNTLVLSGASTYTGNTNVQSGAIQIRGANNILPATTTVVLGTATSTASATMDVRATSTTVAGLSALGSTLTNRTITNTQTTGTTTLIVNPDGAGAGAADSTFGGVIKDGDATHQLALTKAGGRTLTLAGTNTYTGATAVNGGTLLVNGNNGGATGNVTVAAGATLGGTGTIGGATTVNGNLAVGTSSGAGSTTGMLTFSNTGTALTLNGSTLLDINGTAGKGVAGGSDLVSVSNGALVYGGSLIVTLNGGFVPATGSTYDLFDFASQSGGFSSISVTDGTNSYANSFDQTTGILTISPVPEPSTWAAGALCLALAAWGTRRRGVFRA